MALNGRISAFIRGREYRIDWSATQSIANNTSTITCVHTLINDYAYSLNINGRTNSCTVGTDSKNYNSKSISTSGSSTIALGTTTHTISHDNDGKKTVIITGVFNIQATLSGSYVGSITASGTVTLDTIPRASSLSLSVSSVNVGSSITANITRASSSFTHTVEFYINDTYYKKYTGVGTSQSYTIPTAWYASMPSSTSCTAYCRITTYNGSTQNENTKIGSQVTKSFTVNVPTNIKPQLGTVSLDPINITTEDTVSRNVADCKPGDGSGIKSYTFQAISGSTIIATISTTDTSATFGPFTQTGDIKFRVTVTDNRSRYIDNRDEEPALECIDYYAPSFSSFQAYRADSDKKANVNGTYLMCTYVARYASVSSTNNITVVVYYNDGATTQYQTCANGEKITTGEILIDLNENSKTYRVYLTIADNYGANVSSATETVFGQARVFNITKDGTGFAIGKMAERNNLFECRWTAKFDDDIYSMNDTIITSDKKVKKDIASMSVEQEQMFNLLKPVTFKFKNGSNDRIHYGFISQDVEDALHTLNLTGQDFAGFCKDLRVDKEGRPVLDENMQYIYDYALRYSEFIALNTYMIQKLQVENQELKQELQTLKEMIVGTSSNKAE